MRVMVMVKASPESEAGELPTAELLESMGRYNEELVRAGLMLAADGLHPSSKGKRLRFSGPEPTVVDGPFPGSQALLAGFWIWRVDSMDEAVEWVKRAPFEAGAEIELRPLFEAEDFGDRLTPEQREREERLRAASERQPASP